MANRPPPRGCHGVSSPFGSSVSTRSGPACDDDQTLPPAYQAPFVQRTGSTHHLPSGHTPLLFMPDELADLLAQIAYDAKA